MSRFRAGLSVRYHPDVGHLAAVFMLQNVAVVDKIADLREGNLDPHRRHLAAALTPGGHAAVAAGAAVQQRHIVHHAACIAGGCVGGQHVEACLVNVEVVIFPSDVDQLPALSDRLVVVR